jgi:hypothetical protein
VTELNNSRIVWFSFKLLHDAIEVVLSDQRETVSEQTRYLLRELQALFVEDVLLSRREVVVVAARSAYPEYLTRSACICQADRTFGDAQRMAFYTKGAIKPEIPQILHAAAAVPFTREEAARLSESADAFDQRIGALISDDLDQGTRQDGSSYGVVLLSPPDDAATEHAPGDIVNDKIGESGQRFAWTMYQRHVKLADLMAGPATTSALDAAG